MPYAALTPAAPSDPAALLSAPSANRPPQGVPSPGPVVPSKPFRTDPLNREPTAKPGSTARFKPFRTDPLNREPAAKPGSTVPFKPSRIDPLNREPGAFPDPETPPVYHFHETAQTHESTRSVAHPEAASQARKFLPQMYADERR